MPRHDRRGASEHGHQVQEYGLQIIRFADTPLRKTRKSHTYAVFARTFSESDIEDIVMHVSCFFFGEPPESTRGVLKAAILDEYLTSIKNSDLPFQ